MMYVQYVYGCNFWTRDEDHSVPFKIVCLTLLFVEESYPGSLKGVLSIPEKSA
jgi:hypothetical protein